MVAPHSKFSPVWATVDLLDLLSVWGEEAVQSQLCSSCRNVDTDGQISCSLWEKSCDQDTLQCTSKGKELRHAYQKAREANGQSSAVPQTCHFFKELDAILGSDPTSTTKTHMDTSAGLDPIKTGLNQEEKVIDEDLETLEDVEPVPALPSSVSSCYPGFFEPKALDNFYSV
ncbi:hypothetical protein UY3_04401 [Chelonia mydas]|uniref:Myb/SANT-like DNA-binding domain-containing protein n=1 Tax=Chelonia mydas TaxID=8469 RepID=M7BKJ0_CHEMY|nr:hypothetical protein UY3_04401 [Chelonia mydas]